MSFRGLAVASLHWDMGSPLASTPQTDEGSQHSACRERAVSCTAAARRCLAGARVPILSPCTATPQGPKLAEFFVFGVTALSMCLPFSGAP